MGVNMQPSPCSEQMSSHLNKILKHTQNTLSLFSMKNLSQTIHSMAKLVDVLRKRGGNRRGGDIATLLSDLCTRLNEDLFRSLALVFQQKNFIKVKRGAYQMLPTHML